MYRWGCVVWSLEIKASNNKWPSPCLLQGHGVETRGMFSPDSFVQRLVINYIYIYWIVSKCLCFFFIGLAMWPVRSKQLLPVMSALVFLFYVFSDRPKATSGFLLSIGISPLPFKGKPTHPGQTSTTELNTTSLPGALHHVISALAFHSYSLQSPSLCVFKRSPGHNGVRACICLATVDHK